MTIIQAVGWAPGGDALRIIDQTRLPGEYVERDLRTVDEICDAIRTLAVRGAPALGVAGAIGLAVSLAPFAGDPVAAFTARMLDHAGRLRATRPTAVNLPWALDRAVAAAQHAGPGVVGMLAALRREATAVLDEDRAMCRWIGEHGAPLLADGARVLTHCNAGALATAGIGTALAPVYVAAQLGRRIEVYADETRPLLQGSRLTAWELQRAGIPVTVLADNMAAALMRAGRVDACLVGADRIAANGDVANKVGTYALALAARHHGVPFYVAAPSSTIDPATGSGDEIVIEQRDGREVTGGLCGATAPAGVGAFNPAFDVTPSELVTAIITDRGIVRPPYDFRARRTAADARGAPPEHQDRAPGEGGRHLSAAARTPQALDGTAAGVGRGHR